MKNLKQKKKLYEKRTRRETIECYERAKYATKSGVKAKTQRKTSAFQRPNNDIAHAEKNNTLKLE